MLTPLIGPLNFLDLLLIALLAVALPFARYLRARKSGAEVSRSMAQRYRRALVLMLVPLAVLAVDWALAGRGAALLGLGLPIPLRGEIGLALAAAISVAFVLSGYLNWPRVEPGKFAENRLHAKEAGLAADGPSELLMAIQLAFLVGCGAEILFRGFLVWAFAPFLGVTGAVILAALVYALGHGFKTWQEALKTLLAALLFTGAYALTQSLWWLMILHTVMPLTMVWQFYRPASLSIMDTA